MGSDPRIRDYISALLVAVMLAMFTRTFVVQAFHIPSRSMEPGLIAGDHILVNKFVFGGERLGGRDARGLLPIREMRRGDVVVFALPSTLDRNLIKRCLALPAETLEIDASGLTVDHQLVDESGYVTPDDDPPDRSSGDDFGPYTVPEGHVFCLGDRRHFSTDSRSWGPVPHQFLKGRAFMIYWSVAEAKADPETPGIWGMMEATIRGLFRWFSSARWDRTLSLVR